jgi:hypothetical protein
VSLIEVMQAKEKPAKIVVQDMVVEKAIRGTATKDIEQESITKKVVPKSMTKKIEKAEKPSSRRMFLRRPRRRCGWRFDPRTR